MEVVKYRYSSQSLQPFIETGSPSVSPLPRDDKEIIQPIEASYESISRSPSNTPPPRDDQPIEAPSDNVTTSSSFYVPSRDDALEENLAYISSNNQSHKENEVNKI